MELARTLLAVVDEGTFDAAASVLHVTPSAVSQRIKALEQRTGRVLLTRTKPVRLTESGETVVRFARQLVRLEHDTWAELGLTDDGSPVTLPIAVNADSLSTWFLRALTRVPGRICFELHREDQDHTVTLLRDGRVMAAVTSAREPVAGCSVRRLGSLQYLPVASPSFVTQWLQSPLRVSLPDAPVLVFGRNDDLQDGYCRKIARRPASSYRHHVPTSDGFAEAIATGMGWGMVPVQHAAPLVAAGRLVELGGRSDVPLYWQQWKLDSPALAAVADAVAEVAAESLA